MTAWRRSVRCAAILAGALVLAAGSGFARADAPPTDAEAVRAAREVFQGPDYWWKRLEPAAESSSWLEGPMAALGRALRWILEKVLDLIARIFRALFGSLRIGEPTGTPTLWVLVVVLVAFGIWKLYPVVARWFVRRAPAPAARENAAWQTLAESSDLFEQAGGALRAGQHAEAIRLALLALIAELQQRGLLRYDPTRTNREYQADLRPRADLAACFGQLARIYERVWYGRLAAGADDAERAVSLCGSVLHSEGLSPE